MAKQALVIGLGQFGMSLTRALTGLGIEVMAVDRREELVRSATSIADAAVCFDATEESALARTAPDRRDLCVCAIGDESRESSIICTALLRQMGARRVVSRAADDLHERILGLIGAHQVVNPERAFGQRFALRLAHQEVLEELELGPSLKITELQAPESFSGRSLAELELPKKHGVTVVAVRRSGEMFTPAPTAALQRQDVLVVVSKPEAVVQMLDRLS